MLTAQEHLKQCFQEALRDYGSVHWSITFERFFESLEAHPGTSHLVSDERLRGRLIDALRHNSDEFMKVVTGIRLPSVPVLQL